MLTKFLHFSKPAPDSRQRFCAVGQRLYAIGDIHGRDDLLAELLMQIEVDNKARPPAHTVLVFLGDLINRGEASRAVVERVMSLDQGTHACVFLRGNHEQLLLDVIDGKRGMVPIFHRAGARATMISYGVDPTEYDAWDFEELQRQIQAVIPSRHVEFIRKFDTLYQNGDYLFVHAGIRPGVPLDEQRKADIIWIRQEFTESDLDHGALVIHGHSITPVADIRPNRIGIDTGAYASGILTAIAIEADKCWFLSTGSE